MNSFTGNHCNVNMIRISNQINVFLKIMFKYIPARLFLLFTTKIFSHNIDFTDFYVMSFMWF